MGRPELPSQAVRHPSAPCRRTCPWGSRHMGGGDHLAAPAYVPGEPTRVATPPSRSPPGSRPPSRGGRTSRPAWEGRSVRWDGGALRVTESDTRDEGTTPMGTPTAAPVVPAEPTARISPDRRLWTLAGVLALAHLVLMFGSFALQRVAPLDATTATIRADHMDWSMTKGFAGGYLTALSYLLLLVCAALSRTTHARQLRGVRLADLDHARGSRRDGCRDVRGDGRRRRRAVRRAPRRPDRDRRRPRPRALVQRVPRDDGPRSCSRARAAERSS